MNIDAPVSTSQQWTVQGGTLNVNAVVSASEQWNVDGGTLNINAAVTPTVQWVVSGSGTLNVNVPISGSAKWVCAAGDTWNRININAECSVTGDVEIRDGWMEVTENFCTEGDLLFMSDEAGPIPCTSVIVVHPDKSAVFNGKCP